ncbi:hypothetical protein CLOM_g18542 [Closterium sp. NIES-68]|nr:hypothetical protein CLOM_g18542 [Closterium sp. NIES-68]GJP64320.1 hypothetical protein CLOP_g21330 [Closterium sp. NIES-67]
MLSSLALLPALDSLFGSKNGGADVALARERRTRIDIPPEMYQDGESGLRYYDVVEGKGKLAEKGEPVVVHFDVTYRSLTVVSSRQSKLLGGNRVISQPYEFSLGAKPGAERKREYAESANGLFSAQAAPKPPKALYAVVEGMREGGKRTVIVPPEQGYGDKGFAEIPPGATIQLTVELLEVRVPAS